MAGLPWPGRPIAINPAIIQDFLYRVEFASPAEAPNGDDEALRIYPMGKDAPVVIDPRVSSGAAAVGGVRTAVLAERAEGFGETPEELADELGLIPAHVKAAIAFELGCHARSGPCRTASRS